MSSLVHRRSLGYSSEIRLGVWCAARDCVASLVLFVVLLLLLLPVYLRRKREREREVCYVHNTAKQNRSIIMRHSRVCLGTSIDSVGTTSRAIVRLLCFGCAHRLLLGDGSTVDTTRRPLPSFPPSPGCTLRSIAGCLRGGLCRWCGGTLGRHATRACPPAASRSCGRRRRWGWRWLIRCRGRWRW